LEKAAVSVHDFTKRSQQVLCFQSDDLRRSAQKPGFKAFTPTQRGAAEQSTAHPATGPGDGEVLKSIGKDKKEGPKFMQRQVAKQKARVKDA